MDNKFTIICNSCGSKNVSIQQEFDYDYDENLFPTGSYHLECNDCGETEE